MLHNHPGQSGFSEYDLFTFFKHLSIKSMTIVTNKGQVKFITKSNRFHGKIVSKFCAKYFTHINIINDSHIEKLLKKLYSINMIKYKVR
ncbi:Phage protein [Staphylococcus aureus]|nr:Phage protein [Staphylococcus aureus]